MARAHGTCNLEFERGRLAQLGEHHVRNVGVVGSNPMPSTRVSLLFTITYGVDFTVYLRCTFSGAAPKDRP
jgi:hypothetical protein